MLGELHAVITNWLVTNTSISKEVGAKHDLKAAIKSLNYDRSKIASKLSNKISVQLKTKAIKIITTEWITGWNRWKLINKLIKFKANILQLTIHLSEIAHFELVQHLIRTNYKVVRKYTNSSIKCIWKANDGNSTLKIGN